MHHFALCGTGAIRQDCGNIEACLPDVVTVKIILTAVIKSSIPRRMSSYWYPHFNMPSLFTQCISHVFTRMQYKKRKHYKWLYRL